MAPTFTLLAAYVNAGLLGEDNIYAHNVDTSAGVKMIDPAAADSRRRKVKRMRVICVPPVAGEVQFHCLLRSERTGRDGRDHPNGSHAASWNEAIAHPLH